MNSGTVHSSVDISRLFICTDMQRRPNELLRMTKSKAQKKLPWAILRYDHSKILSTLMKNQGDHKGLVDHNVN
jgi:hypothetical protein